MTVKIEQIMERRFTSVPTSAQMGSVEAQMTITDARHILVVDEGGRVAGIVTRCDLTRALDKGGRGLVTQHMTRRVCTVRPGDEAIKAADLMIQRHVGAVAVVDDDDKPLGLVSDSDFLKIARTQLAAGPDAPAAGAGAR